MWTLDARSWFVELMPRVDLLWYLEGACLHAEVCLSGIREFNPVRFFGRRGWGGGMEIHTILSIPQRKANSPCRNVSVKMRSRFTGVSGTTRYGGSLNNDQSYMDLA